MLLLPSITMDNEKLTILFWTLSIALSFFKHNVSETVSIISAKKERFLLCSACYLPDVRNRFSFHNIVFKNTQDSALCPK
jgi:hypothetical protein